ncbi:hypothetical protein Tco_0593983 [Tanacetum coccineum]
MSAIILPEEAEQKNQSFDSRFLRHVSATKAARENDATTADESMTQRRASNYLSVVEKKTRNVYWPHVEIRDPDDGQWETLSTSMISLLDEWFHYEFKPNSKKKRKALGDTKFEGIEMGMVFNQGKVNGEKVVNKTKIGRRSVTKAKEAAWKICEGGLGKNIKVKEIGELIGVSWVLAEEERTEKCKDAKEMWRRGLRSSMPNK